MVLIVTISAGLILTGCKTEPKKEKMELELENFEISEDVLDDISTAKKIFYSLPSPLETAMLIKSAGADYDQTLLNPIENAGNYTTNKSMALNLGIYTTDMSFASLFDQAQTTINYMNSSKKMADGLGILDAIDDNTVQRLEENINNREVIMDIISETFMSSSSYLKENERAAIATVVLVGGWIEGLYIATQLVDENNIQNNELVQRVYEQKLSFDILQKLLNQHKDDDDIQSLAAQLDDLKAVFAEISIKSTEVIPEEDETTNVTTLKSDLEIAASPQVFVDLKNAVNTLRSNFIL
jgi:hypothetical protein